MSTCALDRSVTAAVENRKSVRAFLADEVEPAVVGRILQSAARAPSGTNMQPWRVYVVTGRMRNTLCQAACDAFDNEPGEHDGEVRYYPQQWFEPYLSRRRKIGWDLYELLGITRKDKDARRVQARRNFVFFDAPVGLIFTIHRNLATGSWLDYGMFLQNIMLLAKEAGLDTCPQAAWADYHSVIRSVLNLNESEIVVCGMAMGYADWEAVENGLQTERETIEHFVQFLDDPTTAVYGNVVASDGGRDVETTGAG